MPKTSNIPQTIDYDDITINLNEEGKLQVKDSGIGPEKLNFSTMEKIAEYYVSSGNEASITFSNIPEAYKMFCLFVTAQPSGPGNISLRFNNDTNNNYAYNGFSIAGTSVSSISGATNYIFCGELEFGYKGRALIWISNLNSSYIKEVVSVFGRYSGTSKTQVITGYWNNTSNKITSITVFTTTADYVSGACRIILYGVR